MGKGMARNLGRAGVEVRAWNRSFAKLADLEGAEGVRSYEEAGHAVDGADAVLTMLSDADAVPGVMKKLDGPVPGALWLQMSTIGIEGIERCGALAEERGLDLLDAPVLGTKQPAEEGALIVLASGTEQARHRSEPVFDVVAKRTMWLGAAGAGSRLKVAINSWIVSVVEGLAETLALTEGLGVDPQRFLEAISGGPLDLPYLQMKSKAMLERDFTPAFRLALAAKDADLAVQAARSAGLDLPALEAISARMAAAAREHGDEDLAATYLTSVDF
jgi:3-hydroxyisobutyrate dehydrogenase